MTISRRMKSAYDYRYFSAVVTEGVDVHLEGAMYPCCLDQILYEMAVLRGLKRGVVFVAEYSYRFRNGGFSAWCKKWEKEQEQPLFRDGAPFKHMTFITPDKEYETEDWHGNPLTAWVEYKNRLKKQTHPRLKVVKRDYGGTGLRLPMAVGAASLLAAAIDQPDRKSVV